MISISEKNYFGNINRLMESGMAPEEAMELCADIEKINGGVFMWEFYPEGKVIAQEGRSSPQKKPKPKRKYTAKSKRWLHIEI